jgi:hypothetical protein
MNMTPDQLLLLRRLALNEREALAGVMSGEYVASFHPDEKIAALVRIAALLSVPDSDAATMQWATELGVAAGLEDEDFFHALLVVAPIIGVARLGTVLPNLMEALDLELLDV